MSEWNPGRYARSSPRQELSPSDGQGVLHLGMVRLQVHAMKA